MYMKRFLLTIIAIVLFSCGISAADDLVWTDMSGFPLYGKVVDQTGDRYGRFPVDVRSQLPFRNTPEDIRDLARCSAGLYIRFRSDAKSLKAQWEVEFYDKWPFGHMTDANRRGLDLYVYENGKWSFAGLARPRDQRVNTAGMCSNPEGKMREYMLYLSNYDLVKWVKIGHPKGSRLEMPALQTPVSDAPVLLYGTSITQGGCSSRPGLSYSNIMSRTLDRTVINLGLSGNGCFDYPVAEYMTRCRKPSCIVIDNMANCNVQTVQERGLGFIRILRKAFPDVPILLVSKPSSSGHVLNPRVYEKDKAVNAAFHDVYTQLVREGDRNVRWVDFSSEMYGSEDTVDGVHFTDPGMYDLAKYISAAVKEAIGNGGALPARAQEILKNIREPEFRDAEYLAAENGVKADGVTDARAAINALITRCSDEGGGKVVLPVGKVFCKGSINLKSNVNLYIPEGCEVIFSGEPLDYLPAELTVWEGTEFYNYSSLVRSDHCSNIAVTGKGILNGNAKCAFAKMRPQRSALQDKLRQMGIDLVPVRERFFGAESIMPPNMVEPFGCKNVLIEGITIKDSPFWVIHPVFCDNVTVRGVTIDSHNLNNDGCDPEYTTNVLIEKCCFNTGDDSIAIKAGRDQDAWRIGQKTAGIIIRDCDFSSRCNGLCIGSEMAAGVEDVYMYNVRVKDCHRAIYFKSNLDRGGFIRNVWVDNISVGNVKTALICFDNNYHGARGGYHPSVFRDFSISNVSCVSARKYGISAVGVQGHPIRNVSMKNVEIKQCGTPYEIVNVEGLHLENVIINGVKIPENI